MNYLKIETENVCNGDGLRVVLWVAGCNHRCEGCQNPQTWDYRSGIPFDENAKKELFEELKKDYISGITFSGGDPLHENNLEIVLNLINEIRISFPKKTIWLYTGYTIEQIMNPIITDNLDSKRDKIIHMRQEIVKRCDVLIDGEYKKDLRDITLHWVGSSNQRVVDMKKTLEQKEIVLHE